MKRKIIGLTVCILLSCQLLATTSMAVKKADVQIEGGLGVKVTITNAGDESILGAPMIYYQKKFFPRFDGPIDSSPGMNDPLKPGESFSWRYVPRGLLRYRLVPGPDPFLPLFCMVTLTALFYQNDLGIIGEKTTDALYFCGFVILISK